MSDRNRACAYSRPQPRHQALGRAGRSPSVVVLELDGRCDVRRLRGRVEHVSVTGAWTTVSGTVGTRRVFDVPVECVEAFAFAEPRKPSPDLERMAATP